MTRVLVIVAVSTLAAGCAFDASAPAPVAETSGLPSLGAAESVDSAEVRRPITGTCGMETVEHLIGQPRTSIDVRNLPRYHRVLGLEVRPYPDYRPERLTIRVNERDIVESMSCG